MTSEPDTDRTSVKAYLPSYQKSEWQSHAEELDMSQSEFIRTMVQAGRRGFSIDHEGNPEQVADQGPDPRGGGLETRVENVLASGGDALSWEELLDALSGDLEERLENTLDELQSTNRVRYSGRKDGYVLTDEER